jgi:ribose 5-phosphate isomerase B
MNITHLYIGADHGGKSAKDKLVTWLEKQPIKIEDLGTHVEDPTDYPIYAFSVGKKVRTKTSAAGILICRSGGGMAIAANKMKGVRAVECRDVEAAQHAREHNLANVLVLSGDWLDLTSMKKIVRAWLTTPWSNESRHIRRVNMITAYEKKHNS